MTDNLFNYRKTLSPRSALLHDDKKRREACRPHDRIAVMSGLLAPLMYTERNELMKAIAPRSCLTDLRTNHHSICSQPRPGGSLYYEFVRAVYRIGCRKQIESEVHSITRFHSSGFRCHRLPCIFDHYFQVLGVSKT